jgi:putative ATPase subunit of terminase (gpP-like)
MSKMKLFKQAEQMYLKGSTVSEISLELGIAKRTLFYWKKQYDWDKKRKESMYDKSQFKEDLQKFAQKLMDKIANSNKSNSQISQAEYYSLVNILNFLPELKENDTQNETPQIKTELSPDFIRQIEREILGIE